jgi:hypothetical protein
MKIALKFIFKLHEAFWQQKLDIVSGQGRIKSLLQHSESSRSSDQSFSCFFLWETKKTRRWESACESKNRNWRSFNHLQCDDLFLLRANDVSES